MPESSRSAAPVLLRKRDLVFLLLVLAAALVLFLLPKGTPTAVVIEQDGVEVSRISLSTVQAPYQVEIPGEYPAVLLIEPDGASFLSASCPDRLCVRTGKLTQSGQAAVCLPARLTLRLEGGAHEVDGYTG